MYDAFKEIREEGIGIGRAEGIGIGRAEGIGIGRAEGIGIGIARNNEENITRMLELNVLPDTIAKYLGISEEEVNNIIQSLML